MLYDLYRDIEAAIDDADDWMELAIWAYHQSIPKYGQIEGSKLQPRSVGFKDFNRNMIENLMGDDCWVYERNVYLGSK